MSTDGHQHTARSAKRADAHGTGQVSGCCSSAEASVGFVVLLHLSEIRVLQRLLCCHAFRRIILQQTREELLSRRLELWGVLGWLQRLVMIPIGFVFWQLDHGWPRLLGGRAE